MSSNIDFVRIGGILPPLRVWRGLKISLDETGVSGDFGGANESHAGSVHFSQYP